MDHGILCRAGLKDRFTNVSKKMGLNVNAITIESYHSSEHYKFGGVKNDQFFNETTADDSTTSVAPHLGSTSVNHPNKNSIPNTNTLPGVTGLEMQRVIDEIALQCITSNTNNNLNIHNHGMRLSKLIGFDPNNTGETYENVIV